MLAVTNGNSELAQVLVDHDAQVDCTDKHLRTALHRAVSNNFLAIILRFVGNWIIESIKI
jgi:ankyrin repeat protein